MTVRPGWTFSSKADAEIEIKTALNWIWTWLKPWWISSFFLFWGNRKNQKPRFNHSYNFILIKPCFWPSLVWIQYGGQKTDDIRPSTHRSDCGIDFKHVFENFSANNSVRVKNSFVFKLLLFDCQYRIIYLKYSLCFYANSDTS